VLDGPVRHSTRELEKIVNARIAKYLAETKTSEEVMHAVVAAAPVAPIAVVELWERIMKPRQAKPKAPDFRPEPEPPKQEKARPAEPAPEARRITAPPEPAKEPERQPEQGEGRVNGPGRDQFLA
jgi:hypothetical protein